MNQFLNQHLTQSKHLLVAKTAEDTRGIISTMESKYSSESSSQLLQMFP